MDWGAFGDWIGKIEPGNWSEWVGSILTAGSLLLGFSILRRDRMKDARAQALRILTWYADRADGEEFADLKNRRRSEIRIKNTSNVPVFDLSFRLRPRHWWERSLFSLFAYSARLSPYKVYKFTVHESESLEPGQDWTIDFPFDKLEALIYRAILTFKDASGMVHLRDVSFDGKQKFVGRLGRLHEGTETLITNSRMSRHFHGNTLFLGWYMGYEMFVSKSEPVQVRLRARELEAEQRRKQEALAGNESRMMT